MEPAKTDPKRNYLAGLLRRLLVPALLAIALIPGRAQNIGDALDGFDPDANGNVQAIVVQADGKILVAGEFTSLGGQTRNRIARLNPDGSLDTSFNPDANDKIFSLALQADGKILVGGDFTNIGGQARNRIARLNGDGTLDAAFNPNANDRVRTIAVQTDGKILVGGRDFTSIGGGTRNRIARLHADGTLDTNFDPDSNGHILVLVVQADGKILTGGRFTGIGGQTRNGIARLNMDGSLDAGFDPNAAGDVFSLALQTDGKILAGGEFTSMAGETRNRIARLNADGTLDTGFAPNVNGPVHTVAIQADGKILAGGNFNGIGGQPRNLIGRFDTDGSLDIDFNPAADTGVESLVVQADGKILVGGNFFIIGGHGRNRIARLHEDGSAETDLDPNANDEVGAVAVQANGKILVGGRFTSIGGQTRNGFARFNADGSLDASFDPNPDDSIYTLTVQADGKILVGGLFTSMGGQTRNHIARLHPDGTLDAIFDPGASGDGHIIGVAVRSIVVQADGKILVGGRFANFGGQPRKNMARLNPDGSLDPSFDPNVSASRVETLAVQADGRILIGGDFANVDGQSRRHIARLNADGSLDASFDADAGNSVRSLAVQADGKILVGGLFQSIGGQTRFHIARLNADGSADSSFDPNAITSVNSFAVQADGKILVAGTFFRIGGQDRNSLALLNADGSVDTAFDPVDTNAIGRVESVALQADGTILAVGDFTGIGGHGRAGVARLVNTAASELLASSDDGSTLTWSRGGSSPVVERVTFEQSADGGANWTFLGDGARIGATSNWQLTGLALPTEQNLLVRARGLQMANNSRFGGSSIYETVRQIHLPYATAPVIINEIDALTQSGDTREFIELYDGGAGNTALGGRVLVLFDGLADTSYTAIDLNGRSTDANGYFVIGNAGTPNVDLVIADGVLQNGADAVALFKGNAADFTNGTAVTADNLIDAIVYDSGQADDSGLLALLNPSEFQLNEAEHGNAGGHSLQRLPNGAGGERNTGGYSVLSPTPGAANTATPAPGVPDLTSGSDAGDSMSDNLTNQTMPTFAGTARAGALISVSSSVTGGVIGTGVADSLGNWSVTASSALADNTHQITASADGSAASASLTIIIDTLAPAAPAGLDLTATSDSGTSDSDDRTNDNTPTFEGTAEDTVIVNLFVGGVLQGTTTGAGATPWSFTIPGGSPLVDGSRTITATATDAAGNESVASVGLGVTIDTMAPPPSGLRLTAASDTGSSSTDNITSNTTPTITGSAENGAAISIEVGGAAVASGPSDGSFAITLPAQSDGVKSITAKATDIAGNTSGAGGPLLITIDTSAPAAPSLLDLTAISDLGPSNNDNITSDNTPTITGQAAAGATVTLLADGNPVGIGSANSPWTITPSSTLADGIRQLTARATDPAGNESAASAALGVTIDTVAPTVTINQAGSQADPASGAPVNFAVVFSESVSGLVAGDFTLGGTAGPSNPQLSGSGANYTATAGAVSGEGTVKASIGAGVATDTAGNGNAASTSTDNAVMIDSHGGTPGAATPVPLAAGNGTANGWLEPGDIDVFSFTIGDAKHTEIKTTGNIDTLGRLRNATGDLLNDPNADDDRGVDENFQINQPLAPGTYTVEVSSKGASQSGAYQVEITLGAMATIQPDNQVGKSAASTMGDGIYGTKTGQTLTLTSKNAKTVRGVATIENDGEIADDFAVRGTRGNGFFKVIYTNPAGNVTARITSGTYKTGIMAPGDPVHKVSVTIKPNKKKIVKKVNRGGRRRLIVKKKRITLTLRSVSVADGTSSDSGYIKVQTK